jgi:hypothetical protein
MVGLLGAINIPFYEEMARRIHWWQYNSCRMISYTSFSANLASRWRLPYWHEVCGLVHGASPLLQVGWGNSNFCLLRGYISDYRSVD